LAVVVWPKEIPSRLGITFSYGWSECLARSWAAPFKHMVLLEKTELGFWTLNVPKPKAPKKDKKAERFERIRERIAASHNPYDE
jgi:hypothetical protein